MTFEEAVNPRGAPTFQCVLGEESGDVFVELSRSFIDFSFEEPNEVVGHLVLEWEVDMGRSRGHHRLLNGLTLPPPRFTVPSRHRQEYKYIYADIMHIYTHIYADKRILTHIHTHTCNPPRSGFDFVLFLQLL